MNKEELYERYLEEAKSDPDILGFILAGGRGKGREFANPDSDYDIIIIVKDSKKNRYVKEYKARESKDFEFLIYSFSEFKKEISEEWQRYMYAHLKAQIDRNKKIQALIDEKSRISKEEVEKYISGHLDGYLNGVFRSLKCWRDNNSLGARLEANASLEYFFKVLFAFHDRRSVPYYKHLKWEIKSFPLDKFGISSDNLMKIIQNIIDKADIKSQQEILIKLEKMLRPAGYGKVFDAWGWKLDLMKKWKR